MAGAFDLGSLKKIGIECGGQRPWLGDTEDDRNRCGYELKAFAKGRFKCLFPDCRQFDLFAFVG